MTWFTLHGLQGCTWNVHQQGRVNAEQMMKNIKEREEEKETKKGSKKIKNYFTTFEAGKNHPFRLCICSSYLTIQG